MAKFWGNSVLLNKQKTQLDTFPDEGKESTQVSTHAHNTRGVSLSRLSEFQQYYDVRRISLLPRMLARIYSLLLSYN